MVEHLGSPFNFECDLSSERNAAIWIRLACAVLQIENPDEVSGCDLPALLSPSFEIAVLAVMSNVTGSVSRGGFSPALALRPDVMKIAIAPCDGLPAEVTFHRIITFRL